MPQSQDKPWALPKPTCFLKKARSKTFIKPAFYAGLRRSRLQWQKSAICPKDGFCKAKVMTPHCQDGADSEAGFCKAKVMTSHCQDGADSEAGFCAAKVMTQTLVGV